MHKHFASTNNSSATKRRASRARRGATERLALGILAVACLAVAGLVYTARAAMISVQTWFLRDTSLDGLPPVDGAMLDITQATRGRAMFYATCSTCHAANGRGMTGLGKDLVASVYARTLPDADFHAFIRKGRDASDPLNTTGIAMPPSGGNPNLSDAQVDDVVAYVRALQNRDRMPTLPTVTPEHLFEVLMSMAPAPAASAEGSSAANTQYQDEEYESADIAAGAQLYVVSCISCHGADARGVAKLGKDLVASTFVRDMKDDEALIAFLTKGRSTSDPLNTTKVDMPPRGGNPALNDDRLFQVISYLRWLQKQPGGASVAPSQGA